MVRNLRERYTAACDLGVGERTGACHFCFKAAELLEKSAEGIVRKTFRLHLGLQVFGSQNHVDDLAVGQTQHQTSQHLIAVLRQTPLDFLRKGFLSEFRHKVNEGGYAKAPVQKSGGCAAQLEDRDPGNAVFRDLQTGRTWITSQNHGYAVDDSTLPNNWQPLFVNMNDGSNEGIRHKSNPWMSAQFHPEACSGPTDTEWMFDEFVKMLG